MPASRNRRKIPRFDPYQKLLHRFFEPLIILFIMGRTRGDPTPASRNDGTAQSGRRIFLDDLSYLCDFERGGDTVSSIAIEDHRIGFTFWLASNKSNSNARKFVKDVLDTLKAIGTIEAEPEKESQINQFTQRCLQAATKRITEEAKNLARSISECRKYLSLTDTADLRTASWLDTFAGIDKFSLCHLAHEIRKSDEMRGLRTRGEHPDDNGTENEAAAAFALVHHNIGRLASHIRAPRRLVDNARYVETVLDNTWDVRETPDIPGVDRPEPDGHTELESILGRMMQRTDPNLASCRAAVPEMNRKFDLQGKILEEYQKPSFKPRVHCEILNHEHFRSGKLRFAYEDPYIGCSKRACYLCKLYIDNHPARHVTPASHQNIYLNWSPPRLPNGAGDPDFELQRRVLQGMIERVREDALEQIMQRGDSPRKHPDSTTGITQSHASMSLGEPFRSGSLISSLTPSTKLTVSIAKDARSLRDDSSELGAQGDSSPLSDYSSGQYSSDSTLTRTNTGDDFGSWHDDMVEGSRYDNEDDLDADGGARL